MRKIQLVIIVVELMVDKDNFEEDVLNNLVTNSSGLSQAQLELEKKQNRS